MTREEVKIGDHLCHFQHWPGRVTAEVTGIGPKGVYLHWSSGQENFWNWEHAEKHLKHFLHAESLQHRIGEQKSMPIFDVAFTISTFKKLPDDSQIKVEKLLGKIDGIVAVSANAAIAVAAITVDPAAGASTEEFAHATVVVREMK